MGETFDEKAAVETSPLKEVDVASLDELFSRDPEGYSSRDIETIVALLRRQRVNWEAAEAAGKKTGVRAQKASKEEISLKELGLE